MRLIAALFGLCTPEVLISHVSVFSRHFKMLEGFTKLATSSFVTPSCIVHLTLVVFLMMHGFQQIVTEAERRDNFVVHGLAPLEVKWVISLVM